MIDSYFLNKLSVATDYCIIGGYIRNLSHGLPIKDIDIIVYKIHDLNLYNELTTQCVKNRFGGYRYAKESLPIDFWHIRDSYIIKKGISIKHPDDLLKYVFFNMDAIIWYPKKNMIVKSLDYEKFEKDLMMDIVYPITDFKDKQIKKITRYEKYFYLSEKIKSFVNKH